MVLKVDEVVGLSNLDYGLIREARESSNFGLEPLEVGAHYDIDRAMHAI